MTARTSNQYPGGFMTCRVVVLPGPGSLAAAASRAKSGAGGRVQRHGVEISHNQPLADGMNSGFLDTEFVRQSRLRLEHVKRTGSRPVGDLEEQPIGGDHPES